jgi:hypothetical protein
MNKSSMIYWAFAIIMIVALGMLTNLTTAAIFAVFVIIAKSLVGLNIVCSSADSDTITEGFASESIDDFNGIIELEHPDMDPPLEYDPLLDYNRVEGMDNDKKPPSSTVAANDTEAALPMLSSDVLADNRAMVDEIINPTNQSADDKIFDASVVSGYKNKKAKEIRSHWNNNNWKKYYDLELEQASQSANDWWTNDDAELATKHKVF